MRYYSSDPGDGKGRVVRIRHDGKVDIYAPASTVKGRKSRWVPQNPRLTDYAWEVENDRNQEWFAVRNRDDLRRILKAQDDWMSGFDAKWLAAHPE